MGSGQSCHKNEIPRSDWWRGRERCSGHPVSRVPARQGACPSSGPPCFAVSGTKPHGCGEYWPVVHCPTASQPTSQEQTLEWLLISEEGEQIDSSEELFFSGTLKPAVVSAARRPPTFHPRAARAPHPGAGKDAILQPCIHHPPAPTSSTSTGILSLGRAPGNFWKRQRVQTDCFHYDYSGFNLLALGHQDYEVLS